jgi:imidazole glycerol-phosphate synthase subunit HisH
VIAIVDYGMGNLRSAQKGVERGGHEAIVTSDPVAIREADGVILPGVGAFRDCYEGLRDRGLREPVLEAIAEDKPFLGICVGMQLLFEYGEEGIGSVGLGVIAGRVVRFPPSSKTSLKVPHMGWNRLERVSERDCPLLADCSDSPFMYFVHSYHCVPEDLSVVCSYSTYGQRFTSMVGRKNLFATQFHPEKSQREGIALLRAFGEFVHNVGASTAR